MTTLLLLIGLITTQRIDFTEAYVDKAFKPSTNRYSYSTNTLVVESYRSAPPGITNTVHFSGDEPWLYLSEVRLQTNVQVIMSSRQPDKGFLCTNIWLVAGPSTGTGNVAFSKEPSAGPVTFDISGNYIGFGDGVTNEPVKTKAFITVGKRSYVKTIYATNFAILCLCVGALMGIFAERQERK